MAQTPQKPAPKPEPPKSESKASPPHTLKDPAEGKPPAIIGQGGGRALTSNDPKDVPSDHRKIIGVRGDPIDDGERDPDTIAEEQRRRSEEIEDQGVENWKDAHDSRPESERGGRHKQVPGVSHDPPQQAPHKQVESR